ncbi:MAG: pyruvate carboxylase, partial [Phaeodactylibacter sp.]|nr:pyruvate carboxylase [Phaeodactylibacter sp.]
MRDFLSYKLYDKVFEAYHEFKKEYGTCRILPTPAFFFGLKENEEILVDIEYGKTITVKYLNRTAVNELGQCLVFFRLNGQTRAVEMQDQSRQVEVARHRKVENAGDIGAPLMGNLSKILVKEGDTVEANAPLFVIEAMKMESTITAPAAGRVKKVVLDEKTLVEQDDLILELDLN